METTSQSYVSGISDVPLNYETIGQALDNTTRIHGNRQALVVCHQNIRWTYREFNHAVNDLAAGLVALGLKPGDRIGIWSPNCIEWVVTQFATAKAGLILVNINPAYRKSELAYALNKVECRALILAKSFKSSDYQQILSSLAPELEKCSPGALKSESLPHLKIVAVIADQAPPGFYCYKDLIAAANSEAHDRVKALSGQLQADDPINIQFTSGTTGAPKGATLTHHNIVNNGFFTAARQSFTPEDRLCIPVPLYHCFGMVMGVLGCVTHGASMIFPSEGFEPQRVLEAVEQEKCTALYGVPTMFIDELAHPEFAKFDLSSLRTGIMAGAACPIEVMKRVVAEMHMSEVTIAYGMTETSPVSFQSYTDDDLDKRVTTVGRIHPHVEVKIVDENNRVVPRNTQGELLTRGYSVMAGYWADDERTDQSIDQENWMHSGDLATMDGEGYVKITGRVKDMIIRGGENVYPREIEEFLYSHPKIKDVQIFGIPDVKYGEEICAWVVPNEGETLEGSEIEEFCRDQIAHFKIPREIRVVDAFPMTVTGKVQKFVMRDKMINELGLSEARSV